MKPSWIRLGLALLAGLAPATSNAFQSSWTDALGETTYTISGPDQAAPGDSLVILLTVHDASCLDSRIASDWLFLADSVQVDGGPDLILEGESWAMNHAFVLFAPGVHSFEFSGDDLGHCGGGEGPRDSFYVQGTTTILAPQGACCFPDGTCLLETEELCLPPGSWIAGGNCTPNPCPAVPSEAASWGSVKHRFH